MKRLLIGFLDSISKLFYLSLAGNDKVFSNT